MSTGFLSYGRVMVNAAREFKVEIFVWSDQIMECKQWFAKQGGCCATVMCSVFFDLIDSV